jgi:hypothetical protein
MDMMMLTIVNIIKQERFKLMKRLWAQSSFRITMNLKESKDSATILLLQMLLITIMFSSIPRSDLLISIKMLLPMTSLWVMISIRTIVSGMMLTSNLCKSIQIGAVTL